MKRKILCFIGLHSNKNTGNTKAGPINDQMGPIPGSSQIYYEKKCIYCGHISWNANPHNC